MAKANQSIHNSKPTKCGFDVMMIVYLAVAIVIMGIVSQIGIYILEKVSDKTALVHGDTFMNASNDSVDAVETGFDFQEILILGVIASAIIGLFIGLVAVRR